MRATVSPEPMKIWFGRALYDWLPNYSELREWAAEPKTYHWLIDSLRILLWILKSKESVDVQLCKVPRLLLFLSSDSTHKAGRRAACKIFRPDVRTSPQEIHQGRSRCKICHAPRICRFFDTEARRCTIYTARPTICREYPGGNRCGYYDFLSSERNSQNDPDHIATTWNK